MGNQASSRRVSFENEEPDHVVKVSENVVELLKQTANDEKNSQQKNKFQSQNKGQESERKPTLPPSHMNQDGDTETLGTSLEEELKKNNEYWENRIKDLQERHEKINNTWEREYKKAFDDVEMLFGKTRSKDSKTPCSVEKSKVISCYKKNADQPLKCAAEVQAFSDCLYCGKK